MLWKYCNQYTRKFGKLSMATGLKKVSFHSKSKERQCQRMLKLPHNCTQLTKVSKVMFKILQSRLQQYMNHELPDIQAGFRQGRGTRRSNCQHLVDHRKSKRVPEKYWFLLYWLCQSLWLCGSQQTVENSSSDGNTRPLDLPLEKSVCRSRSNR